MTGKCPCDCHGHGPYGTCDIEGGCGHLHPPERRCASGPTCVKREREHADDGTHWLGALLTQPEGLCPACLARVAHTLGYLPTDIVELTRLLGCGISGSDEIVSSTCELPVPIRLGIEALRSEIDFELQYWAEIVAAELGIDWGSEKAEHSRLAVRAQRAARFLAPRVDTLVGLGPQERCAWTEDGEPLRDTHGDREIIECSGIEGALRLVELHRRVYRAAGRTQLVHRLIPACPWCDQRALVRHNGSDMVECESCREHIDEKYYNWFVILTVREEERRRQETAAA